MMKQYVIILLLNSFLMGAMEQITKEIVVSAPIPLSAHFLKIKMPREFYPSEIAPNKSFSAQGNLDFISITNGTGEDAIDIVTNYKARLAENKSRKYAILEDACEQKGECTRTRLVIEQESYSSSPIFLLLHYYSHNKNYAGLFFSSQTDKKDALAKQKEIEASIELVQKEGK